MRRAAASRLILIFLFVCVLAGSLTAVNFRFTKDSPGGNDFLNRWLGTRLFLTERQSPYSLESTLAIQQAIYGHPADADEDQVLFAYPLYAMIFFTPFSLIADYALARALWITFQEIALIAIAISAISISGWKPSRWTLVAFLLFALTWFHGTKPLVDGNASILVALLVTLGLLALRRNRDALAGFLFALSTIKPQMVVLILPFIALWSFSVKRKDVVWSMLFTLAGLVGLSFLLQPNWLTQNIAQVLLYQSYTPPSTLPGIFAQWWGESGSIAGLIVCAICALALLYEWGNALGRDFDWFLWTLSLTIVIGPLVGLPATTSNYSVFLMVFAWIFALWQRRVGAASQWAVWINLGLLFFGIWAFFLLTLRPVDQFREHLGLLFPAPLLLLLNLYWMRWWLLRPAAERTLRSRTA